MSKAEINKQGFISQVLRERKVQKTLGKREVGKSTKTELVPGVR